MGDVGMDERTILQRFLRKEDLRMCTKFTWLSEHGNETSDYIKGWKFLD
jgi:hypothetical protein